MDGIGNKAFTAADNPHVTFKQDHHDIADDIHHADGPGAFLTCSVLHYFPWSRHWSRLSASIFSWSLEALTNKYPPIAKTIIIIKMPIIFRMGIAELRGFAPIGVFGMMELSFTAQYSCIPALHLNCINRAPPEDL
jgi:hypothetical protein